MTKENIKFYMHVLVTLILMFGFGFLEPFGQVTPLGMKMLGIFLGLVYSWTFTSMIWSSLLAFVAVVWTGAYTMSEFLAVSMGNSTVCFMLFSMILIAVLTQIGLIRYFGNWFASRTFLHGHPWFFTWFFLFGCFLMAALTNGTAATLIFLSLFFVIAEKCKIEKRSRYMTLMVFGIIFTGMTLGATALPFHLAGMLKISTIAAAIAYTLSFTEFTLFAFPSALLLMSVYVLIMRFVLRADVSALDNLKYISMEDEKLTKAMKIGIVYLIIFVCLLFIPEWLSTDTWLGSKMKAYSSTGAALLVLVAMLLTKVDGKPLANFQKAASEGIVWNIIILFAIVLPFSNLLVADATGIKATFVGFLKPLLSGHSPILFMFIALGIQTIATNFMNNAVLGVIFTNVMGPIAIALGMNPLPVLMVSMFTNQLAYFTPAASAPAAMLFGYGEYIEIKDIYKSMPIIIVLLFIVSFCIILPWGYFTLNGYTG